jgi:hypothetical protein
MPSSRAGAVAAAAYDNPAAAFDNPAAAFDNPAPVPTPHVKQQRPLTSSVSKADAQLLAYIDRPRKHVLKT